MSDQDVLVDVGPATPPPVWCLPGAEPEWETDTPFGSQVGVWMRQVGGDVWISCEDSVIRGRVMRSEPRIFGTEEPSGGWTASKARELVSQIVAAADLIAQAVTR